MRRIRRPPRPLMAALGAAFLLYLVAGHAYHPAQTMDQAAMGAGICIVLVTIVGVALRNRPRHPAFPVVADAISIRPFAPLAFAGAWPQARASPVWLQRFLN